MSPGTDIAAYVAGFVAAEGYFGMDRTGTRFRLAIGLGAVDEGSCRLLLELFGVGTVTRSPRRRAHYDDEVTWQVQALPALVGVVVPFMDAHLPPSHKQMQYIAWRAPLLEYWHHRARRVRPCGRAGCPAPSRCKGLCRRHYYLEFGR